MIRTLTTNRFSPHAAFAAFGSVFSAPALLKRLEAWSALARQRRQLAELDEAMLRDIGRSKDEVAIESARPFWDVPKAL